MLTHVASVHVTPTKTETEALLLEARLIRKLQPKYNILLKDDKSFPYILVSHTHPYPRVCYYRSRGTPPGMLFGPFASREDLNAMLDVLQHMCQLRACRDSFFAQAVRPCLQYQIQRCSGPCVGYIDATAYQASVAEAVAFLKGDTARMRQRLRTAMAEASAAEHYEAAALWRDRLRALDDWEATRGMPEAAQALDADIVVVTASTAEPVSYRITCAFYRGGHYYGHYHMRPRHAKDAESVAVITAALRHIYTDRPPPPLVLVSCMPEDPAHLIAEWQALHGSTVALVHPKRGGRYALLQAVVQRSQEDRHETPLPTQRYL
jgi:excinuclease ABC subunit C